MHPETQKEAINRLYEIETDEAVYILITLQLIGSIEESAEEDSIDDIICMVRDEVRVSGFTKSGPDSRKQCEYPFSTEEFEQFLEDYPIHKHHTNPEP